jgi:hypothetical protein
MSLSRVRYRVRQFQHALWSAADPEGLEQARSILTPAQLALFAGMQASEQAHALSVCRQLVDHGETLPDLLVAALLHDVGKCLCPLRLWERVLIVLGKAIFPAQVRRWGNLPAPVAAIRGWKRAFVVAEQHPAWGAELAVEAGASPRTVALIRHHQDRAPWKGDPEIECLLGKLQAVDDHN